MDWMSLAEGLAQRIAPALPAGISMRVELTGITIAKPSVAHAWCHISVDEVLNQGDDRVAKVETAAAGVEQFEPVALNAEGELTPAPDFFMDFGDMRPHQVRLGGGDASSDSFCFP
jgi:hypothetical protein